MSHEQRLDDATLHNLIERLLRALGSAEGQAVRQWLKAALEAHEAGEHLTSASADLAKLVTADGLAGPATSEASQVAQTMLTSALTDAATRDRLAAALASPPASLPAPAPSPTPAGTVTVPVSPVIWATLQGVYSGGARPRWTVDEAGRPQYRYEARDGHVKLLFEGEPGGVEAVAALWSAVRDLSVETADIFLILMARIAELADPRRDIARIRLEEIGQYRDVRVRDGRVSVLHEAFKREVLRLADLRLTMVWRDYGGRGTLTFGEERPDRLLDIVDVKYTRDGRTWTAFGFRCGVALAHFLTPGDVRWVGQYARALLKLDPYHDALAKKIGSYWSLTGTIAAKKGQTPRATLRSVLAFCGVEPHWERPGRTVEAVMAAHNRLLEIGLLTAIPDLEPPARTHGFLHAWLDTPRTVHLTGELSGLGALPADSTRPAPAARRLLPGPVSPPVPSPPASPTVLQAQPSLIRDFRTSQHLNQETLARALGVRRETLSRYERKEYPLPLDVANRLLALWRQKVGQVPAVSSATNEHP